MKRHLFSIGMLAERGDERIVGTWTLFEPSREHAQTAALERLRADFPPSDGWDHEVEVAIVPDPIVRMVASELRR